MENFLQTFFPISHLETCQGPCTLSVENDIPRAGRAGKHYSLCTFHRKDIVVGTRWLTLCGCVIIRCHRQCVFSPPVCCRSVRGSRSFFTGSTTELCVLRVLASLFRPAFESAKWIRHSHPAITLIASAITTVMATVTSVTISPGTGSFLLLCSLPQAHFFEGFALLAGYRLVV